VGKLTIYVLQKGDYERTRNIMVTTDVKEVAKKYVEMIEKGAYGDFFENPYIQIWTKTEEDYPEAFHENIKNEQKLIKYLSKLAKGIS
jgi:hypothetical protein